MQPLNIRPCMQPATPTLTDRPTPLSSGQRKICDITERNTQPKAELAKIGEVSPSQLSSNIILIELCEIAKLLSEPLV